MTSKSIPNFPQRAAGTSPCIIFIAMDGATAWRNFAQSGARRWSPESGRMARRNGVAMAEAGGLHRFSGAFGAPGETTLAIVNGGCGYVVDVLDPAAYAVIPKAPITGVSAEPALGLLFLATFSELTAIDTDGLLWVSERLVLDDLKIQRVTLDAITATGTTIEGTVRATVTVDPMTGAVVGAKPRLPKQLSGPPWWHR